jgi:hypothetical protein
MKVHSFGTKSVFTSVGRYKDRPAVIIWNEKHSGEAGTSAPVKYNEMPFWKRWWIQRIATVITFDTPERAAFVAAAIQSDQSIAQAMINMGADWSNAVQNDLLRSS